ncbi:hypothetical protein SHJG_0234 [Streptomyces hygroscopicus subsp. jinggangensis 5008]|nr:hypothetical protein SHJG_0234 [Streptomyces hygroscopicus subsp. jinggangensis 5008]
MESKMNVNTDLRIVEEDLFELDASEEDLPEAAMAARINSVASSW